MEAGIKGIDQSERDLIKEVAIIGTWTKGAFTYRDVLAMSWSNLGALRSAINDLHRQAESVNG